MEKKKKKRHRPLLLTLRRCLAVLSIVAVTLLFVDFTGLAHRWLGWMARIQFLPAVLSLNVEVMWRSWLPHCSSAACTAR